MLNTENDIFNDKLIKIWFWSWFAVTILIHLTVLLVSWMKLYYHKRSVDIDKYTVHEYGLISLLWVIKIVFVVWSYFIQTTYGHIMMLNAAYYFTFFMLEYLVFEKLKANLVDLLLNFKLNNF